MNMFNVCTVQKCLRAHVFTLLLCLQPAPVSSETCIIQTPHNTPGLLEAIINKKIDSFDDCIKFIRRHKHFDMDDLTELVTYYHFMYPAIEKTVGKMTPLEKLRACLNP